MNFLKPFFRCSRCYEQFTSKNDLIIHTEKVHKPPRTYDENQEQDIKEEHNIKEEHDIKEEPSDFVIQTMQIDNEEFDTNEKSIQVNNVRSVDVDRIPEHVLNKLEKFEEITPIGFRYIRIEYNGESLYLCEICHKTAPSKGSMRNHKLHNHKRSGEKLSKFSKKIDNGVSNDNESSIPEDEFNSLEKFEEYLCEICHETAPSKDSMRNHKLHNHNRSGEKLSKFSKKIDNAVSNDNESSIPEDEFKSLEKFEEFTTLGHRYIKVIYKHKELYACEICRKTCRTKIGMNNHMRNHGSTHKAIETNHTNTIDHGDGSFSCKICGKVFTSKNACHGHTAWHSRFNEEAYKNSVDDIESAEDYNLVESENPTDIDPSHSTEEPETKYSCDICGKTFANQLRLNGHISLHSRNGEYKSKSFQTFTENLKNKLDIQSEDKIFFVRKELGEKVYFCKFCDKNFTSKGGVLYHASRKHISNGGKSSVDNNSHENTILR